MTDKTEKNSGSPLMDGLLRERFSSGAESDARAVEEIIAALRKERSKTEKWRVFSVRVWRAAAAVAALLAPVVFYCALKDRFSSVNPDSGVLRPFVLTAAGATVSAAGSADIQVKRAAKLSGPGKVSAGAGGSAFVIFPDLSKAEIAAGGSLSLDQIPESAAPSRFGAPARRALSTDGGVFRFDTGSAPLTVTFPSGKISADRANFIVAVKPDYCFCEVYSGAVNLSFGGENPQTCSIAKGKSFTVRTVSGMGPVITLGAPDSLRAEIASAKGSLTDLRRYDNILSELLSKNSVDICLNKDFKRKLINDLKIGD
jgi:hypothetical protein